MATMAIDELATELRATADRTFDQNDMLRGLVFSVLSTRFEQCHTQITIAEEALEILAKLGNEPHDGNSTGNVLAQKALKRIAEARGESDGSNT